MLARMMEQPNESKNIQEGKEIFIDRAGDYFSYILNYFRDGDAASVPFETDNVCKQLVREAAFYQLPGLINLIKRGGCFSVGDSVELQEDGQAYVSSIMLPTHDTSVSQIPTTTCWLCLDTFECSSGLLRASRGNPEFNRAIVTRQVTDVPSATIPNRKYVFGEILEISDRCATVEFAWSCIKHNYPPMSFFRSNQPAVVKIHIPLAFLKQKRVSASPDRQ